MAVYRVCKRFVVESGHMLSKHPASCRFPHGHTRTIEVVVAADSLDANDMVIEFKALKLALEPEIERYDHAMAINSDDPFLASLGAYPEEAVVVVPGQDPTTEVLAKRLYDFAAEVLAQGFEGQDSSGVVYRIPAGRVRLERVRVWETPSSWAEVEG